MDTQQLEKPSTRPTGFWRRIATLNIRGKIILPYFVLTLALGIVGTYVVTRLVVSSLDERLTNQLLEAGRVVSDNLNNRERAHLETAQLIAFTRGLNDALNRSNRERTRELVHPVAATQSEECIIVVDTRGDEMLHLLKQEGRMQPVTGTASLGELPLVRQLLEAGDPLSEPQRGIGLHPVDHRYYYFTAIPVRSGEKIAGVVIIGTALDTLLPHFKATSLADVILYSESGEAIASTFALGLPQAQQNSILKDLAISAPEYTDIIHHPQATTLENDTINARSYRLARAPLKVKNDTLGVFAVVLPANFLIQVGENSRNTYSILFTAATAGVILIGYLIAQRITDPLDLLVHTSQAVAEGNLNKRTGIQQRDDEIGILATTFDSMTECLAERTAALEKLLYAHKETASRLQAILSSIGDGVVLSTPEGRFTPLNATATTLFQDMQAQHLNPARELAIVARMDQGALGNFWQTESERLKVGKKTINCHSAAVRTDEGEFLGTVIVLRDITAEVETEELKDAFIAHVSHELRTPLTAIKGYSQLLSTTATLNPQQRLFLQTITRNTNSLIEMINGLLDFSEVEAHGKLGLQCKPLRLEELIQEIADEWRPAIEDKQLALRTEIAPDLPQIEADIKRLRWAIVNLVRNAVQYTLEGEITFRLNAGNGQVILDIADTGIGISPADQEQLFARFFRVSCNMEQEVRGLGVGLYVARAIVEAHQGEIRVATELEKGSTFSIVLPALDPALGIEESPLEREVNQK